MTLLSISSRRRLAVALGCLGALVAAGPASASHLKGGSLSASISATDQLSIDLHWMQTAGGCQAGVTSYGPSFTITAPGGATKTATATMPATRCAGNTAIVDGTTTFDLTDSVTGFGPSIPSGTYKVTLSDCCRVGGIVNASGSGVALTSTVNHVPGVASASPRYIGSTAAGASQGFLYSGDITAVDDSGDPLTYNLLQSTSSGLPNYDATAPNANVVSLTGTTLSVPAATTAGWTLGSYYAFKTDAATAAGEHAVQDALIKVTSNRPPAFATVPETFEVTAGQPATLPLTATDPDGADTVTITSGAAPAWAAFSKVDGNPATAQLVFTPPLGVEGTFLFPIDAADNNTDAFLQDTRVVRVHVSAPKIAGKAPEVVTPAEAPVVATPVATPAAAPVPLKAVRIVSGTDGVATLTLTVPGPGTIHITGLGRVNHGGKGAAGGGYLIASTSAARKPLTLFAKTQVVQTAGSLQIDFKLQRKSIRDLAKRGLLRVDLTAVYTPSDGGRQLTASKSMRLKAFTLMTIGKPQLLSDGRRLRLTVRVPRTGKLWAKVSADHDGGRVTLGRSVARPVRRGEALLDLDVSGPEAQHVLKGTIVPLHLTAVLDHGGKRQTRTRKLLLVTK